MKKNNMLKVESVEKIKEIFSNPDSLIEAKNIRKGGVNKVIQLNNYLLTGGISYRTNITELEIKIMDLLKIKPFSFSELVKELNIQNGDREILLTLLGKLERENKIKKENDEMRINDRSLGLTTRFFL